MILFVNIGVSFVSSKYAVVALEDDGMIYIQVTGMRAGSTLRAEVLRYEPKIAGYVRAMQNTFFRQAHEARKLLRIGVGYQVRQHRPAALNVIFIKQYHIHSLTCGDSYLEGSPQHACGAACTFGWIVVIFHRDFLGAAAPGLTRCGPYH